MSHLNNLGLVRRSLAVLALWPLVGALTTPAQASVLIPGPGEDPPDIFALTSGLTLLADENSGTVTSTGGALTFSVESAVYKDQSNTFGAGDLDFVYQVTNSVTSPDSIARVTAINFTGFDTDVGYTTNGASLTGGIFANGLVAPATVDRVSPDVVGFSFSTPPNIPISPGLESNVLVIETNATSFTTGAFNVIDGGVATVNSYEPSVPEPTTGALTIGLLSLGCLRRCRGNSKRR